jgi:hypothetical protein
MLKDFTAKQQIPFRYVLVGFVCTTNPDFIEAVESLVGAYYLGQASEDTPCWHNHHIMTYMLAHYFLWHTEIKLGKKHLLLLYRSFDCY